MNTADTISSQFEWEMCVVCGKSAAFGGGTFRIERGGKIVNLCGPDCMAAFARDPMPYLAQLAKITDERALRMEKVLP